MARQPRKRRLSSANVDARFARAEAERYILGPRCEKDTVQDFSKHTDKTKKEHNEVLEQYVQ